MSRPAHERRLGGVEVHDMYDCSHLWDGNIIFIIILWAGDAEAVRYGSTAAAPCASIQIGMVTFFFLLLFYAQTSPTAMGEDAHCPSMAQVAIPLADPSVASGEC